MKHKRWIPVLAALVIVAMVTGACRVEDVIPRGTYNTALYVEQGGAKMVVESGGEIEMQDGSTLDVQSGTTATFGGDLGVTGALDVTGATTLGSTLDVGGDITLENDETISNDVNGVITMTATTIYNAASYLEAAGALGVRGGDITLENDDTIGNSAAGTIDLTATTINAAGNLQTTGTLDVQGGNITLQNDDTIANAGSGNLDLTATTVTVSGNFVSEGSVDAAGGDLVLQNDETIGNAVNGTILLTADSVDVSAGLDVDGLTDLDAVDIDDAVDVDGDFDVTGAITFTGKVYQTFAPDSDATSYDYGHYIGYYMTGTGTKDRNYGLFIEGSRQAGEEIQVGDHDEAGLKIRVDTKAITTTAGTVLRGMDIEAKADNPDGTVTSLYGASLTAKSDSAAGDVGTMIALTTNVQNDEAVDDALMSADFRLMRQAATEPTVEYVVQVRNSSTSGTGADAGIYITSDYSDTVATDDMDYGIDMSTADITTADIRGDNGETLSNVTDTAWIIGGFIAAEEGSALDLGVAAIITPTATYQPLTVAGSATVTTSASTAIADGPVAGAILILVNEDASYDIVVKDGANTKIGGDITLTANQDDQLMLIWNGADWVGISNMDN